MDLYLQSLSVSPWQLQRSTEGVPLSCSSLQLGLLARKSQLRGVRCSVVDGEGDTAQEKSAAKGLAPESWLQADANADPYFGWTSDGSQTNDNSWIKIGGGVVLAIGFALGARTMYTRKEATRQLAVPPVTEQTVSPSKASKSAGVQDYLDGSCDMIDSLNSNQEEFMKQEKETQTDGPMPDVRRQEKSTAGQVSRLCEDVEDHIEKEDNFNVSSFSATTTTFEENLEHKEGFLETSAADTTLPPPSENVTKKGSVTSDPNVSVVDGIRVATEVPEEDSASSVVSEIADTYGEDMTSVVDLPSAPPSTPSLQTWFVHCNCIKHSLSSEGVCAEGDNAREPHYEPDVLIAVKTKKICLLVKMLPIFLNLVSLSLLCMMMMVRRVYEMLVLT